MVVVVVVVVVVLVVVYLHNILGEVMLYIMLVEFCVGSNDHCDAKDVLLLHVWGGFMGVSAKGVSAVVLDLYLPPNVWLHVLHRTFKAFFTEVFTKMFH